MIQAAEAREMYLAAQKTPDQEKALEGIDTAIRRAAFIGKTSVTLERGLTDVEVDELTRAGYDLAGTPTETGIFWGIRSDVHTE